MGHATVLSHLVSAHRAAAAGNQPTTAFILCKRTRTFNTYIAGFQLTVSVESDSEIVPGTWNPLLILEHLLNSQADKL